MNAIYARVSTDEQAKSGYSLQEQIDQCRKKLHSLGLTNIKELIDDGYSGAFLERPGLDELRSLLKQKLVKTVVVYDPDRLARDLEHLLLLEGEIRRAGAQLYFVTGDYDASPVGKLFFSIRGAFAAYERAVIRERTSRGRKAKAQSGKIVLNARPYGYDWDAKNSTYVINPEQAKVVEMIYDMYLNRNIGARRITAELASMGIVGQKGTPLSIATVDNILSNEMYCGTHYQFRQKVTKTGPKSRKIITLPKDEWISGEIPAIVSRETWLKARQQAELNKRTAGRNCQRQYLLRGILKCALCGRNMMPSTRPGAPRKTMDTKPYSYYTCITKESSAYALTDKCECSRIPLESFENTVWDIYVSIAQKRASFADFMRNKDVPDYTAEIIKLSEKQNELKKRHAQIAKLIIQGLLDADAVGPELEAAQREINHLNATINALMVAQDKVKQIDAEFDASAILNATTFEEKRNAILKSGKAIYAVRSKGSDNIDFYFE